MNRLSQSESRGLWRMADTNWNRVAEGLRVLEDYYRFVKDDGQRTLQLKQARHYLAKASESWSIQSRLAARDAAKDVGRTTEVESEYLRPEQDSLLQANFARVQQGLRVLEEVGKRLGLDVCAVEAVRYQVYQIQAIGTGDSKSDRASVRRRLLDAAQLYVLVHGFADIDVFCNHVERLVSSGADVIQLRDKTLDDGALLVRAKAAAELTRNSDCLFIVNDRADLAVAADADGVHVGQTELPPAAVRSVLGDDRLIGLSTHNAQQVSAACQTTADYIGVGPVFFSKTKSFRTIVGVELLRDVAGDLTLPAFAIGGINATNIDSVKEAGFGRVAVSGAVSTGSEVSRDIKELKNRLSN